MANIVAYGWEGHAKQYSCVIPHKYENEFHVWIESSFLAESWQFPNKAWAGPEVMWMGAADGGGAVAASTLSAADTKQVYYVDQHGDLQEMLCDVGAGWRDPRNLSAEHDAPHPAVPAALTAFAWNGGGTRQALYVGVDNHIHEIALPFPLARELPQAGSLHTDLTVDSGGKAPPYAGGGIAGYSTGQTIDWKQVVYADTKGQIHELFRKPGDPHWQHANLHALAKTAGPGIHPLYGPPSSKVALAAYFWEPEQSKVVVYTSDGGDIHQFASTPAGWRHDNVTASAKPEPGSTGLFSSTVPKCLGPLAAYAWPAHGTQHILYRGDDGGMHELSRGVEGQWHHRSVAPPGMPEPGFEFFAGFAWDGTQQVIFGASGENRPSHEVSRTITGSWQLRKLPWWSQSPNPF